MGYAFNNRMIEPYLFSHDGVITAVNEGFVNLTGFTMDKLVGKSLMEIGDILKINSQIFLDNKGSKYSGFIFTKSLEAREVNISLFYGKETNEKVYTFIEKPNSRLNDKLIFEEQTFIDNIRGVAVYSVPDLILLKANQKYLDFLDSPFNKEENSIGRPIREIVTGYTGSENEVNWNTILETQKTRYIREFTYDKLAKGITYWDSILTSVFESGKIKYIFETTTEVTERVENLSEGLMVSDDKGRYIMINAEAMRSRYEFLERMIDTFDVPVVRLSCPDLKVVSINKKAFSIIKLLRLDVKSISEIKEKKIEDLSKILKISEYNQCVSEVFKEKKTKHLNRKKYMIDGNEIYFNIIFEPMFDVNEELQEILILIIDVTTEIKSNIIMEKALKSQEQLLANISHELKTPLNVIFTIAQLLDMYCNRGSLDEKKDSVIKYIDSIKQNSYRLSKLINNIVDLSKIEAGFFKLNLSNNNIVEVVEETVLSVTTFTEIKGINIIFDTDTEEKIIACDAEKIERIVLNLISNAIKFSNIGDEIFIDIKDKNEFVEISVKDNGIGLEANHLDMIFDRFKQVDKSLSRNAEGTGIGLSLVKSIVELHGGHIYVESELGRGSKFTVMLPTTKVMQENMLFSSNVRNTSESIQIELSDVYL